MKIGILAIHGSVEEHARTLKKLGVVVHEVRSPEDLEGIQGIILPGGESTAQSMLMKRFGIFDLLKEKIKSGLPAWGTCAGAILLAKEVGGKNKPETFTVMDISVERNWYGAQLSSFITPINVDINGDQFQIEGVFIRAPKIEANSTEASTFAEYNGSAVIVRQKNMLASAFHPELTDNTKVHEYFVSMCS